jgi:hypothetical protein
MDRHTGLREQLAAARAQLVAGGAADAERQARAISALVRAERDVAELIVAGTGAQEDNEEELRAELRRRVARFVEAASAGAPDAVLERIATGRVAP